MILEAIIYGEIMRFSPVILLAICTSCATVGVKFEAAQLDQIKEGVTTKDQVIAALGQPRSQATISSTTGETTTLLYVFASADFSGSVSETYSFSFGKDGILIQKTIAKGSAPR
jgi:outer membrane protein assembly factor BamE (lipoprotein component of BamABCDE complex)